MGSIYCRPQTQVLEDPNVAMYTDVGYSILTGIDSTNSNFITLSYNKGMVYVKDGALHHEVKLGSRLYCKYAKHSFKLCNIKRIEVVRGNITILRRKGYRSTQYTVPMKLGLRIIFKKCETLVMAIPDPENFCTRLNWCIISSRLLAQKVVETVQTGTSRMAPVATRPAGTLSTSCSGASRSASTTARSGAVTQRATGSYTVRAVENIYVLPSTTGTAQ